MENLEYQGQGQMSEEKTKRHALQSSLKIAFFDFNLNNALKQEQSVPFSPPIPSSFGLVLSGRPICRRGDDDSTRRPPAAACRPPLRRTDVRPHDARWRDPSRVSGADSRRMEEARVRGDPSEVDVYSRWVLVQVWQIYSRGGDICLFLGIFDVGV